MSYMWIGVEGVGYGGVSGGLLRIIAEYNNINHYYKTACQGVSLSTFGAAGFFEIQNDTTSEESESVLQYLCKSDVRVNIEDGFVVNGKVEMDFEVFSATANTPDPIYKTTRRFNARGFLVGNINILTTIESPPVELTYEKAEELRRALMAGFAG